MARSIRIEYEQAVYHVMARGNRRSEIYGHDGDRQLFLRTLGEVVERFQMQVHVYCLMSNHYHLIIETPLGNLSRGIGWLQNTYTIRYNKRHRKVGHLFQGRYKAILVEKDPYARQLISYIHLNPVRVGVNKGRMIPPERWEELKQYPWSSLRFLRNCRHVFGGYKKRTPMKTQRKHTAEFKKQAVELLLSSDKTLKEVAQDLGIHAATLRTWRQQAMIHEPPSLIPEAKNGSRTEMERELRLLKEQLRAKDRACEILKKAIAICSESQRGQPATNDSMSAGTQNQPLRGRSKPAIFEVSEFILPGAAVAAKPGDESPQDECQRGQRGQPATNDRKQIDRSGKTPIGKDGEINTNRVRAGRLSCYGQGEPT